MKGYFEIKRAAKKMDEFSTAQLIDAVLKRRPNLSCNADTLIDSWVAEQVKRRIIIKTKRNFYAIAKHKRN